MKEGWKYMKLGEVGTFSRGGNFSKNDFVENGFPCIHYGQIHMKFGTETFKHISSVPIEMVKRDRCAHKGDLVIAITSEDDEGSCKCTAWMGDYDVYVGGHTAIYRHTMQPKYVSYYFMSPRFQTDKLEYTHGFKVVEINPKDIAKITIPVPPLSEQQRIVSYLDTQFAKIDQLKENAERQLQAAKDLWQKSLNEMLEPKDGWMEMALKEIGKTQTGSTPSMSRKDYYDENYIPFIKPSEINYDGIGGINYETQMLSKKGSEAGRVFEAYSIFMVCIGATISKLGISDKPISCNQQINVLTPKETHYSKFVYYAMLNPDFIKQVIKVGTSAQATLPIISKGKWEKLKITIPQYAEQKMIADKLDELASKIKKIQDNYNATITLCNDLKQSLLKDIFE